MVCLRPLLLILGTSMGPAIKSYVLAGTYALGLTLQTIVAAVMSFDCLFIVI